MSKHPVLFVSHGSPMLAITDSPAQRCLKQLSKTLPRPKAVVIISAHWESMGGPAVSLASAPETIHDFGGFSPVLRDIRYPAPGAPEIAEQAATLLQEAGFEVRRSRDRGLDHGAWIPMYLMYPDANIPTFQVSVLRGASAAEHERLGRALAALREQGVLIIGSGSLTHNLYEFGGRSLDSAVPSWVSDFSTWMMERLHDNQKEASWDYRQQAPFAARNHPTDEHLMPLFVAMGAAGDNWQAERIHASVEYSVLAMDVYAFS
ncbi:Aromatic ring-opening dioxygenase, catalytic subunit, LigB family [Collimonas sp. OK607]|uniref:DODA-type extradiol aromatic ring-opening family dioxygenase n=1 Tax=Collimonas sp. OK607 TaxID=1798194 RepID=UPI0008E097ED|nr:class III extradiol ring-cleavage dioxygenase [Collimonas sp. OK607]SFB00534.1 Aromatic ring-opening dioxygenase, catalytic subunit, LigB family [Collimonas sp. OK607]